MRYVNLLVKITEHNLTCFKYNIFFLFFFILKYLLIYKNGKPKLLIRKYLEKILKNYAKEPIFRIYRTER